MRQQAVTSESSSDFLRRAGTDAAIWAAEFNKIAAQLGYSRMDEGWLIGWFANAIEAGRSAGIQYQQVADPTHRQVSQ